MFRASHEGIQFANGPGGPRMDRAGDEYPHSRLAWAFHECTINSSVSTCSCIYPSPLSFRSLNPSAAELNSRPCNKEI
jgi:hypothetical protein